MIKSLKIRLIPTKEQEELMRKSIGVSRWAYNYALSRKKEVYECDSKSISEGDIRKEITQLKKTDEFKWLNEVSAQITTDSVKSLDGAFKNFFSKRARFPKFKSKRNSRQSFYVRYDTLYFNNNFTNLEKIGKVKFKSNRKIPDTKYSNPRCSFDGKYWHLTFGIEFNENQVELKKESVGIDLGIKDLAICSNGMKFKNINKSFRVKTLKKKLKRLQRKVSIKYELNKEGKKFIKTNNIIKLEVKIKLLYRKLTNIRQNHTHQTTNEIIKYYPKRIVLENLNIKGMMKNKHLSKAIAEQNLHEFRRQIEYKAKFNGIEVKIADRFYPSSKTCSCCGYIKKDLKLSDRVFKCECGNVMDRDLNASINLAKYS